MNRLQQNFSSNNSLMNSYTDKVLQMELEEIEGINKVIYHQYIDTIYI